MQEKVIFPKRYETVTKCLDHLASVPQTRAYQSELNKKVGPKSWRRVVKRELSLLNEIVTQELGYGPLIIITTEQNPKTRRTNEKLYKINPNYELTIKNQYYIIKKTQVINQ